MANSIHNLKLKDFKIVKVRYQGYGEYRIMQRKNFLFIPYWTGTHLCESLEDAKEIIRYLLLKETIGTVWNTWAEKEHQVSVRKIGKATSSQKEGSVICSSFNAG